VVGAAAAIAPNVDGVFTIGGTHTFGGIDGRAAARRLTMPALFVAAENDDNFAAEARELYEAAGSAEKRLAIFPGSAHGAPQLRNARVRALVDDWIRERLAP
jgi:pimeloyl-ACP methyl ester carboxylesterase